MKCILLFLLLGTVVSKEDDEKVVGGVEDDDEHDPQAVNALNGFFIQFIRHATENDCFDKDKERVVIGKLEKITKQVVAGEKFEFILRAGVSNKCSGAPTHPLIEAANGAKEYNRFFVKAEDCGMKSDDLGEHKVSIVWQEWKKDHYNYPKIEDIDGKHPLEGLWTGDANGCKSHRI